MDKNTLSNYGWIVIAVLVLSVMIALATPFGEYIKAGVESTTAGLFDTSEKALNVIGMSAKTEEPEKIKTGTASGSYIVLNDVSSKTHNLKITLSSDTITDFSTVSVSKYNSNCVNVPNIVNDNLKRNDDGTFTLTSNGNSISSAATKNFTAQIAAGVPIFISAEIINTSTDDIKMKAQATFTDGTKKEVTLFSKNTPATTLTFDKDISYIKLYIGNGSVNATAGHFMTFKNLKMNIGAEQEYEDYISYQRVTASADGTVTGLTSVAPNMTLVANTSDVTITCEYQRKLAYNLKEKTIVNFGDSIFGNYKAPNDISTMIANKTGATVYNVGFGSAQMSENSTTKYEPFGMKNLADAITTGDWTTQDAVINSGNAPTAFKRCLPTLKSIDFNSVDIITIAYGTNDFKNGKSLDDVKNAAKHSIETIKNKYPHIDIVLCVPVYRYWIDDAGNFVEDSNTKEINGVKLTDYIQLYKEIGSEYGLVVIDNYTGSGITASNRAKCFTGTDTTHPNETGRQMIAENMAKELYKYFG